MSGPPTNKQRVILGPLTSTWTAPSSCSIAVQDCQTCTQAWAAQTCFASTASTVTSSVNYGVEDNTDCWPPRSSFASTPVPPLAGWGFYSPGLDCPYGMTPACSATGGGTSGWSVQYGLLAKETAVGCCPLGYSCANGFAQTCVQTATSTSFQAVTCESGTSGGFTYLTVPATISSVAIPSYTLFAPLIQINWQATDRPSSSSTSSPASNTSPIPPPPPLSGLSGGAKAGIGVGMTLVAIALLGLGFFIYWKRRHAYARAREDSPTATQVHELGAVKSGPYAASELPTREPISELPPEDHPDERVYELRG
ncbi:hypothetical protein N431DRAFT_407864 [Stipitochalara longipes BDJ]|nr:hypothetical protein N431DRAFT_407864 [Stipitochalara longipes BDJ]